MIGIVDRVRGSTHRRGPVRAQVTRRFVTIRAAGSLAACAAVLSCGERGAPVPVTPTFAGHVAPILRTHCVGCHHPDGPAPFSLHGADSAPTYAALIAAAVRARRMPPWPPSPGDFAFAGERRLEEREIRMLERWAATGAVVGELEPRSLTSGPPAQAWVLGEPDLILEMAEAFTLAADSTHAARFRTAPGDAAPTPQTVAHAPGRDVFRNFVLPVRLDSLRWVRAVEFQPGDARVVHHLVMAVDTTAISREEDARDALPGFDGMLSRTGARAPGGFFIGWTPGQTPRPQPAGLAWPLQPGSDLVLQMHLRPRDQPVQIRARVGLYFAAGPPDRTPLLIRLGGQTLDIPAGESNYVVTDSFRLPVAIRMFGVYPHAHYLGRTMHVRAVLPNGRERTLLRIDDWDFNWQDAYAFATPVPLPAGTSIHLRYTYDNSAGNPRNPARPPRRVVYGPASTDEMAELWIQAVAQTEAELPALQAALADKSARDRVQGWEHLVRLNRADASAHANLGRFHQASGDLEQAARHYTQAITAEPDYAAAHYNLGIVREARGELDEAVRHYRDALRVRPDHAGTHNNLGNVLFALGRMAQAAQHFERAIQLAPDQPEPHANYGRLLWQQGRTADALVHYHLAVAVRPAAAVARFNLMLALATAGESAAALAQLDTATQLAPPGIEPRLALAWLWATHADAAVRRPVEAMRITEQTARLMDRPDARALDVFAAANAAAGNYEAAVRFARAAHDLARAAGESDFAARIGERLELYLAGRPYLQASR